MVASPNNSFIPIQRLQLWTCGLLITPLTLWWTLPAWHNQESLGKRLSVRDFLRCDGLWAWQWGHCLNWANRSRKTQSTQRILNWIRSQVEHHQANKWGCTHRIYPSALAYGCDRINYLNFPAVINDNWELQAKINTFILSLFVEVFYSWN